MMVPINQGAQKWLVVEIIGFSRFEALTNILRFTINGAFLTKCNSFFLF